MSSNEIDEGPSQQIIDEEFLDDDYRILHEESEKINEHGIGRFSMFCFTIYKYFLFSGFDVNGLPIEMNI